ncbi:MAG: ComEC/Rec2 family competence protein [Ruminococcaceae bacterium]|nr:ComEC/Rec2 family competence protein [Oscillospiraceae bacterium]
MFSIAAAGFAFTFGCFIGCFLKSSMILPSFIITFILSIVLFFLRKKLKIIFASCLFLSLSFLLMFIHNSINYVNIENLEEYGYEAVVEEASYGYCDKFTLRITKGELENRKLLVETYVDNDINKGDTVYFKGKIENFPDELGFDERISYASKGVFLKSAVDFEDDLTLIYDNADLGFWDSVKSYFSASLYRVMPKYAAELTDAMLLGNRVNLDERVVEGFKISGGSHFLAVSGLHLSILVNFVSNLLYKFKIKHRIRDIILIIFLVLYMALTGFRFSVQRAGIMAIFVILARIFGRIEDSLSTLAFAGFIICFINPYAAADIGFILSFTATLGIVLVNNLKIGEKFKDKHKFLGALGENVIVTLSACVFTLPVSMCYFGYFSPVTILTSVVLSIPVTVIISSGLLTAVLSAIFAPLALLPALAVTLASKFAIWYVSLISPASYYMMGEVSFFVFAFTFIMLLAFVKKPSKSTVIVFVISFFGLLGGALLISRAYMKPTVTVESFDYGYIAKISDRDGTLVLTNGSDGYISVYGEEESVYGLNEELTISKENYIIHIKEGWAVLDLKGNKILFNTDKELKENADVQVFCSLKAKADADINIIVTESGIDNLKSRLSKGNYLLTESITFTFENNILKFY